MWWLSSILKQEELDEVAPWVFVSHECWSAATCVESKIVCERSLHCGAQQLLAELLWQVVQIFRSFEWYFKVSAHFRPN